LCFYFFLCSSCSSFCLCCWFPLQPFLCTLIHFILLHFMLLLQAPNWLFAQHMQFFNLFFVWCDDFFCLTFIYIINMYGRPLFYLMPLLVSFFCFVQDQLMCKFALH
jgi:hypothetical protein